MAAPEIDSSEGIKIGDVLIHAGNVDGRDVSVDGSTLDGLSAGAYPGAGEQAFLDADHTKLNGIETGATTDQSNAEIRAAAEAATDSNVFTDSDHTKLNGIATGADNTPSASTTVSGKIELATSAEINTGTQTSRANTPDALAGSIFGTKTVVVKCILDTEVLETGNGKAYMTIPVELNGMNLVSVGVHVYTASSSGTPTFQIHNLTDTVDMLSTRITIDVAEKDSATAATPPVINTSNDDVVTGNEIRLDCDVAGTGTKGMEIRMGFRLP